MPRLPRLRIEALAELARQLRFEPSQAARRQLARAEELALQVLSETAAAGAKGEAKAYPQDFVIFRITGYRPDSGGSGGGAPVLLAGEALLGDLAALIERLSAAARITAADGKKGEGTPLSLAELRGRWGVSAKTVERYRRLGLYARRVQIGRGRQKLVFPAPAVGAFEGVHGERIEKARRFTRIPGAQREKLVRRARRYRTGAGLSLDRAATRLAKKAGRGKQTVRRLIRKAEREAAAPVFNTRDPLTESQEKQIERLAAKGVEVEKIATHFKRTRASIHRVLAERRAARLWSMDLSGPVGPTFGRAEAAEVLLAPAAVRTGLGRGAPGTLDGLLEEAEQTEPDAGVESARAVAYWFLLHQSRRGVAGLEKYNPSVAAIDRIETDLRWASRLKAELVRSQIGLAVRTIESLARTSVRGMTTEAATGAIGAAVAGVIDALEKFDPFKGGGGGRPAAPAGLAVNRTVSAWLKQWGAKGHAVRADVESERLAARTARGGRPRIADWTRMVNDWQVFLEPAPGVREAIAGGGAEADELSRRVLTARMGWGDGGEPPMSVAEAAKALGLTVRRVGMLERRALAQLARPA